MKPRTLFFTTAAILAFGLASVAGSQPDQKDHKTDSARQPARAARAQQQHQAPAQNRQQPPSAQNRQPRQAPSPDRPQQPAAQNRQPRQAPSPNRPQQPAAQNRQPRQAPSPDRPQQPAAQNRQPRQAPAPNRPQQPAAQNRQPRQAPSPNRPQQPVAPGRDRSTPPPRLATQPPIQPRASAAHVEQRTVWPRYRAQSWSSQHRTWGQRGGYNGYRIPGPQFSLYFGQPHRFHLSTFEVRIVGAYPQFYADGFWFTMLDPVPEYWQNDWYDTDELTIVESEDGYYLLDEAYPDAMLAISVQLP